ncbi:MAG: hypothetical protein HQK53_09690 [Oligoflexia bacterium]|nr:hypothetical protein [Oligoflexia bacterium]
MKRNIIKDRDKIGFTFIFFCILFLLVLSKAFYVQVVIRKKLVSYANGQLIREDIVYPKRGNIYDRSGNPLAVNIQSYSLFTIPRTDEEAQTAEYKKLVKIIPKLNLSEIQRKVYKRNRYTWIIRKIKLTDTQIKNIEDLEGIYILPESGRFYPNRELLSQALGFVGLDNVGLSGVEFKFDKILRGNARVIKYLKDAKGRPVKFEIDRAEEMAGEIFLSIDKELQSVAEKYLKEAVIKNQALKGGIGILDPHSGEVLAIANYPSYDPNMAASFNSEYKRLPFITDPFEPGSMFKIFTVISALENKIARPNSSYYCEKGKMKVVDHIINEAESNEKFEWLTVEQIIEKSSNIGISKIAFDLTFPLLRKTLKKFNFGEKTEIEISGESRGIMTSKANVDLLTLSNISFGQGIAVTGMQMLSAYAAIANGGYYVRPTILRVNDLNKVKKERIISPEVAQSATSILQKAVEEGTGFNAKINYFKIAGKTATAQRPNKAGGYNNDSYISGFIGFPVNVKKNFVMLVYIEDPKKGEYYGNKVAAPVFKEIAKHILYENRSENILGNKYELEIPKQVATTDSTSGEVEDKRVSVVSARDDRVGADVGVKTGIGAGVIDEKVPNFIGLDKYSALILAQRTGLKIEAKGIGIIVAQKPKAGLDFATATFDDEKERTIELQLEPPNIY